MHYYNEVKHFHKVFKHPAPDTITLSPYSDAEKDEKIRALRGALLVEEIGELEEAMGDNDIVEVADACADIAYVALGALVCFGLSYTPYQHPTASGPAGYRSDVAVFLPAIKDGLGWFEQAMAELDVAGVEQSLNAITHATLDFARFCNIDMDAVFDEVQRSNMSKLDENGDPILREDGKILKGKFFFRPDLAKVLF